MRMFYLLRPILFRTCPYFFRTMLFEYPFLDFAFKSLVKITDFFEFVLMSEFLIFIHEKVNAYLNTIK